MTSVYSLVFFHKTRQCHSRKQAKELRRWDKFDLIEKLTQNEIQSWLDGIKIFIISFLESINPQAAFLCRESLLDFSSRWHTQKVIRNLFSAKNKTNDSFFSLEKQKRKK